MVKTKLYALILTSLICFFMALIEKNDLFAMRKMVLHMDSEYHFLFQYPSTWGLRKAPKEIEIGKVRVFIQSPDRISLLVTIESLKKKIRRNEFDNSPNQKTIINRLIENTIDKIYRKASTNMNALRMVISEKKIFPSKGYIRFDISTVHLFEKGNPILIKGIHSVPFGRNYLVSFIMTTTVGVKNTEKRESFRDVFNSFHMLNDESGTD